MGRKKINGTVTPDTSDFVRDFIELELRMLKAPTDLAKAMNLADQMWIQDGSKRYNAFLAIYRIMTLLYPDNKPTMGQLRKDVSLSWSTATRIMDFLVEHGDCQRLDDEKDRRVVRIALTNTGKQRLRATQRYVKIRSKEILAVLSTEEQKVFINLFSKIASSLRAERQKQ